jgi:hypothetical protein
MRIHRIPHTMSSSMNDAQQTSLENDWPIARDKKVAPSLQHECLLYSFDDFLWRRHDSFPNIILIFLMSVEHT